MPIPIISNGNVRVWGDIQDNLQFTGADGVMIGETLLGNPWSVTHPSRTLPTPWLTHSSLFANTVPDPVDLSLEYLGVCREYPGTATIPNIQTHIRHFIHFQWLVVVPMLLLGSRSEDFCLSLIAVVGPGSTSSGPI